MVYKRESLLIAEKQPAAMRPLAFFYEGNEKMATTRIMPLHTGKGRNFQGAISAIIDYVENPEKTEGGALITSFGCDSRCADAEFLLAKKEYIRKTGRTRGKDDVIAYHFRQSFVPGEITPEEANRLGVEFVKRFTKENHAFVVCTHTDKAHIHNHIVWSAVNLDCDRKFRNFWGSTRASRKLSDTLCIENGYSIVENPRPHGKSYNKWLGAAAKNSHREDLRVLIDAALSRKPKDMPELLDFLREAGCEVGQRGKSITLRMTGWKKNCRMDSLGEGYSPEDLEAVIFGKKKHSPREKKSEQTVCRQVNLLVDIQAKLQEGKGAGYERWAKVFNLKQMAQTMNFLTEHKLLDYDALQDAANNIQRTYGELSEKIKNAEARMTEISLLRTQIINYARTRDTYTAYRKNGYSKKFYAEHEQEIILHKAAKKVFEEMGYGKERKLPTVKNLQIEFAQLLDEKKKAYGEYRKIRNEMKNILTAKANVDRILNMGDEKNERREKTHGQR